MDENSDIFCSVSHLKMLQKQKDSWTTGFDFNTTSLASDHLHDLLYNTGLLCVTFLSLAMLEEWNG